MSEALYSHSLTDEIAQYLKDICPEFDDLNTEELLLMQESAFEYLQKNNQKRDTCTTSNYGETSSSSLVKENENESATVKMQLALDEELARALELGIDDFNNLYIHGDGVNAVENTTSNISESPIEPESQNITQDDDIDPDRMTYEELQDLGESVGCVSKGLPQDQISRLPTFKYKVGFLSNLKRKKKDKKEECVICCEGYKNGARLTTLPCAHQFHSQCITTWLQTNKQCPVCKEEVEIE